MKKSFLALGAALLILGATAALANDQPVTTAATGTAATAISTGSTTKATSTPKQNKKVTPAPKLSCIQQAVEKRENALVAALDKHSASVKTALVTRGQDLKAAWGIADNKARQKALNSAWQKYNRAAKAANSELRIMRRLNWQTYEIDRKKCGVKFIADDAATKKPSESSEATNL